MTDELLNLNQKLQEFLASYQRLEKGQHSIPDHDLTIAEVHLLVLLAKGERMNLSQLAERRQISRSAVTQMVNRLVKKGYLKKEISGQKKSAYNLVLTQAGQKVYLCHQQQHDFLNQQLTEVLQTYPKDFLSNVTQLMTDVEAVWESLAKRNKEGW